MMGWYGNWPMMGWFGGVCMVVVVVAVAGIAFLVMRASRTAEQRPTAESPGDVLRRRYAAGELSQQDFERMRQAITARSAAPQGSTIP